MRIMGQVGALEYKMGIIFDVMNDLLLSLDRKKFSERGNEDLAVINKLRQQVGAFEIRYE
jgi:hypothetical protein